jgi:hypothetical protein
VNDYRDKEGQPLRVLFWFGVTQTLFDSEPSVLPKVIQGMTAAFDDLEGRFGVKVLGNQ